MKKSVKEQLAEVVGVLAAMQCYFPELPNSEPLLALTGQKSLCLRKALDTARDDNGELQVLRELLCDALPSAWPANSSSFVSDFIHCARGVAPVRFVLSTETGAGELFEVPLATETH